MKSKKSFSKIFLSTLFVMILSISSLTLVYADSITSINSLTKDSLVAQFDMNIGNATKDDLKVTYRVGNGNEQTTNVTSFDVLDSNRTQIRVYYDRIVNTNSQTENVTVTLTYKNAMSRAEVFSLESTNGNNFKVISAANGNFVVEFEASQSNVVLSSFDNLYYLDSQYQVTGNRLPLTRVDRVSGYNDRRYQVYYTPFTTKSTTQKIEIDLKYLNSNQETVTFFLYSNGSIADGSIINDYANKSDANFTFSDIKNGEFGVRFNKTISAVLTKNDFNAVYYINNQYRGPLTITGVEDGSSKGIDYKIFTDSIEITDKDQLVTVLLFYRREDTKPVMGSFLVDEDEYTNQIILTLDKIVEFTDYVDLADIKIEERGLNLIWSSPNNGNIEQIKIEAPEGFEWDLGYGSIVGTDGLKDARVYRLNHGTTRVNNSDVEKKNILLIQLYDIPRNRSQRGTLTFKNFRLHATDKAATGNVNINFGGAGIPYETFTAAKLTAPILTDVTHTLHVKIGVNYLYSNGAQINMDTVPFIEFDRTMLPVKFVATALGLSETQGVGWDWDDATKIATFYDGDKTIKFTAGSTIMYVNNVPTVMDAPAIIKDSRIFVPIRWLGEALSFQFTWDGSQQVVTATRTVKK